MASKYDELRELWIENDRLSKKWIDALKNEMFALKDFFETSLELEGKTWRENPINNASERPYVYLTNLKDANIFSTLENVLSEDGSARFKLVIVLEKDEHSYPKEMLKIPVAIKYSSGMAFYGICKPYEGEPAWKDDMRELETSIIANIKEYYSFNPMDGFETRTNIGFL